MLPTKCLPFCLSLNVLKHKCSWIPEFLDHIAELEVLSSWR